MLLIIDGYNVINGEPRLQKLAQSSLEEARHRLETELMNYCGFKGWGLMLVFDAHLSSKGLADKLTGRHAVIYTGKDETADNYIERYVAEHPREDMLVVSNDALIQIMVFPRALRMSVRELALDMTAVFERHRRRLEQERFRKNALEDRLDGEIYRALDSWRKNGG